MTNYEKICKLIITNDTFMYDNETLENIEKNYYSADCLSFQSMYMLHRNSYNSDRFNHFVRCMYHAINDVYEQYLKSYDVDNFRIAVSLITEIIAYFNDNISRMRSSNKKNIDTNHMKRLKFLLTCTMLVIKNLE